ncbi:MAG TPA: carbamoyltransferase C-terminal domain-containing protein [Phycicoccus sp.]|nr:carbamoyltransferase C-terminal domain-containing protein [Phycicoccus sp.]
MSQSHTPATVVLGINSAHDASACVLVDGRLVVAVGEERLTRVKHHEGYPHRAVAYCLEGAGVTLADVNCVVINEYPQTDHALELVGTAFRGEMVVNPSHHLLHAYYAWVASGFDDTAILVVDGSGYSYGDYARRGCELLGDDVPDGDMDEAETWFVARDGKIELIRKVWGAWKATSPMYRFPSLGHMYSAASQYIFGHFQHAGKTMGLAPFGDASRHPGDFVHLTDDGVLVDTDWMNGLPRRSDKPANLDDDCLNLAAKVQAELERAVLHICGKLHDATGSPNLAISGGVGLNSVVNGRVLRESAFDRLFITPAAGDAGVAIGAALYGHHRLTGELPQWEYCDDYHGRPYDHAEIRQAAAERSHLVRIEPVDDPAVAAAADIAAGQVVGWFEGGSEFGPRSLGHRSILCDPRTPGMRDRLNKHVKFREPFRPYAASVLAAHVPTYFDLDIDDPFMLIVADVRSEHWDTIPSVVHVDRTCRIQSVPPGRPDGFERLIREFHAATGMPMVLNTSFNIRGEPIVETPGDAIDCFLLCNVDTLYIEGYRAVKTTLARADAPASLVPRLGANLSVAMSVGSTAGVADPPEYFAQSRTGHRRPISRDQFDLLRAVDGRSPVAAIAAAAGRGSAEVVANFVALQAMGLVAVEMPSA